MPKSREQIRPDVNAPSPVLWTLGPLPTFWLLVCAVSHRRAHPDSSPLPQTIARKHGLVHETHALRLKPSKSYWPPKPIANITFPRKSPWSVPTRARNYKNQPIWNLIALSLNHTLNYNTDLKVLFRFTPPAGWYPRGDLRLLIHSLWHLVQCFVNGWYSVNLYLVNEWWDVSPSNNLSLLVSSGQVFFFVSETIIFKKQNRSSNRG